MNTRVMLMTLVLAACGGATAEKVKVASPTRDMTEAADLDPVMSDAAQSIDLAWTDLAGGVDIASSPDMSEPRDLAKPSDFADYPGCGGPGLPTGASCANNTQCCHGLCGSANNEPPYICCFAHGTNCQNDGDCCSGTCSVGKTCF